jgi:sugar phosphate isomerase/epimerase
VHAKDYRSRDGRDDVPVGDGVVGYEQLLPAAVEAGAEWLVVEEDEVGDDPFGAVERSLQAVRRILAGL